MWKQFCTRTAWWVVPLIWLPVVCWFISMSMNMGHTLGQISFMVIFGIYIWTLIEYIVHRFLFHIETSSYWLVSLFFCTVVILIWEYVNNNIEHIHGLGGIPCIILFMVATTSTQWIVYDLFFLLLPQLF